MQLSRARADIAARIAAAPDMSVFIAAWTRSFGLRLMPLESYMMPFPTRDRRPVGLTGLPRSSFGR